MSSRHRGHGVIVGARGAPPGGGGGGSGFSFGGAFGGAAASAGFGGASPKGELSVRTPRLALASSPM